MNIAKVNNLTQKSNIPFEQRMKIARSSFNEPQKLNYKKGTDLTPFEQFERQNESDYRSRWSDASEYCDASDDNHFDYLSTED